MREVKMTDASDRGWGSGWPTVRTGDMVPLEVEDAAFPGGVHREIAGLMAFLLEESIDRGWVKLHPGWCWGYANRPIKKPGGGFTETPSNHSWGLAIDINAPENPFGSESHTIPEAMGDYWETWKFRWGGHYSSAKDWMHFEFMGTADDARALTLKAVEGQPLSTAARLRTIEWAEGLRRFFRGEPEPEDEGAMKRGWADGRRMDVR
jgi:hypothetical protein